MAFTIGAPLLDGCVLAALSDKDTYGYALTQQLKAALDISESTLYPVLRRLQKEGYLTAYDRPYQGRNRRYYGITMAGLERLEHTREEWTGFRESVETLLMKKEEDG